MTQYRPLTEAVVNEVLDYCHEAGVRSNYEGIDRILRLRGWASSARTVLTLLSNIWVSQHPGAKMTLFVLGVKAGNEWLWADSVVEHAQAMYSLLRLRRLNREAEEEKWNATDE